MKKILFLKGVIIFIAAVICVLQANRINAVSLGSGLHPIIQSEKFAPAIWMCEDRVADDDNTEPGRTSYGGQQLVERINNYAFEGEQLSLNVLIMDKNGISNVKDVSVTMGNLQGTGNDIEANCRKTAI